jgi:hypothetical protein
VVGDIENAVILLFGIGKDDAQIWMHFLVYFYRQYSFTFSQGHAAVEQLVGAENIKVPDELPGMIVNNLAAFFELIELFQDRDRYDDIMFIEMVDAGAVMENDIGIKDENLFFIYHVLLLKLS